MNKKKLLLVMSCIVMITLICYTAIISYAFIPHPFNTVMSIISGYLIGYFGRIAIEYLE